MSESAVQRAKELTDWEIAQRFHAAYEELAPGFGYKTREASATPWSEVPPNNQDLMAATVKQAIRPLIADLVSDLEARDREIERAHKSAERAHSLYRQQRGRTATANAEVERLREALKVIANCGAWGTSCTEGDPTCGIKTAAEALAAPSSPDAAREGE